MVPHRCEGVGDVEGLAGGRAAGVDHGPVAEAGQRLGQVAHHPRGGLGRAGGVEGDHVGPVGGGVGMAAQDFGGGGVVDAARPAENGGDVAVAEGGGVQIGFEDVAGGVDEEPAVAFVASLPGGGQQGHRSAFGHHAVVAAGHRRPPDGVDPGGAA